MIAKSDSKLFGKNINPKRKKTQTSLVVNTSLVAALAGAVPAISGVGWDKSFHVPEIFTRKINYLHFAQYVCCYRFDECSEHHIAFSVV